MRWPDGRAAPEAEVTVGSQYNMGGRFGGGGPLELRPDSTGRFEARALSGPPYLVRAKAMSTEDGRVWRALSPE